MRHIDITQVIDTVPPEVMSALSDKHQELVDGDDPKKIDTISAGGRAWKNTRDSLENASHRKCWYTESKNPGCVNDVDHFRPKARKKDDAGADQYWYWFLAFDPENYRLSCQFSNRLNVNPESGLTGGKGDQFPLLNGQSHATTKTGIALESPVLIDPCNPSDCNLLEFQPDGRPVVSSKHRDNPVARYRVEQSNLLLNLDFPTFNEDREALYNQIIKIVKRCDGYAPDNPAIEHAKEDLSTLMDENSPYSKAAECYIRCFRDRKWVEQLLFDKG